jgi:hypothetical protein
MNEKYTLFETNIFRVNGSLDVNKIFLKCQYYQQQHKNVVRSNRGGYQAHNFDDSDFTELVMKNVPVEPNKPLPKLTLQAWVNINGPGHWNTLHNHLDAHVLISGVYYVRVPLNSGDIIFYDPRFLSNVGEYYRYYHSDEGGYISMKPESNLLLFFPPSLMHMVGPNESQEERCSIAFNLLIPER